MQAIEQVSGNAARDELSRGESFPTHVIVSAVLRYSRTFALYRRAFQRLAVRQSYVPHELPLLGGEADRDGLTALMRTMRSSESLQSIVVSDPYKQIVLPLLDSLTPTAEACGAVNLITQNQGRLVGDNFDGPAFRLGVESECGISFRRQSMVFFGCGGVSSAIALELAGTLSRVGLIDVRMERAERLAEQLQRVAPRLKVDILDRSEALDLRRYNLFYNGTGLGKFSQNDNASMLMPLHLFDLLPSTGIAFDANYTPWETAFLSRFNALGFATINGFSHMLAFVSLHLSKMLEQPISYTDVRDWAAQIENGAQLPT